MTNISNGGNKKVLHWALHWYIGIWGYKNNDIILYVNVKNIKRYDNDTFDDRNVWGILLNLKKVNN